VHRVQAQAVEAVSSTHISAFSMKKVPHFTAAEVDGRAQGVCRLRGRTAGVAVQVIAVGAEVVVDHIENHRQTVAVGAVDQVFELFGVP
jgi:hypothetical protein